MSEADRNKSTPSESDSKNKSEEQKKNMAKDKLREKLEKLKKDDPNIYPVF